MLQVTDAIQHWSLSLRTEETRCHYALHLRRFCRFHGCTPEALLKDSLEESKSKVLKYIYHLKSVARPTAGKGPKGSISVNSLPTMLNGVQSFYEFYEVSLNWKKYRKMLPEKAVSDLRSYQREEIRALLLHADLRDTVLIMLMLAAGPRVGALPELRFKHLSTLGDGIGILRIYPNSAQSHYVSLLTPEAMKAIEEYKKARKAYGEKVTEESWLVREKFSEFGVKRNNPKQLTKQAIYKSITRLMDKAKIKDPRLQPDHSFRYFFDTAVMNSDVRHEFKELFMGHSIGLDDYYYDAKTPESQSKILFEYSKAVDSLTISEENRQKKKIVELERDKSQFTKYLPFLDEMMRKAEAEKR